MKLEIKMVKLKNNHMAGFKTIIPVMLSRVVNSTLKRPCLFLEILKLSGNHQFYL